MDFTRDEEKGLTSPLHSKRLRGYGAAVSSNDISPNRKQPKLTITHTVSPSDTLQSLAVKYDSTVADIKRVNGLWNNESLVLRDGVKIPVYSDVNLSVDENGHAELPSTSTSSMKGQTNHRSVKQHVKRNSADSDDPMAFFAKFDTSVTSLKKKVAKQVENASM